MTPEQKAFESALGERLRERARALLAGEQFVLRQLVDTRRQILETLAGLPSDAQQWQLSRLLGQVNDLLDGATARAGALFDSSAREIWTMGEDAVDKPLAAAGQAIEMRLPALDAGVLQQMRAFGRLRLKDVGTEAGRAIGAALSQATMGMLTPYQAIQRVNRQLANPSLQRASTIVRTELGRVFAVAGQQRLAQAADLVPDLQKQWRRSGKIHSRWNHDVMDGVVVGAKAKFKVPNPGGGIDLMSGPHDPKAPAEQVINCGCIALPHMKGWQVMTPGARPFTKREIALDGRKAALDQKAKRAGLRREGTPQPA